MFLLNLAVVCVGESCCAYRVSNESTTKEIKRGSFNKLLEEVLVTSRLKKSFHINVLVYPELSVTEEMSLSCRSTSCSSEPTVSPKLSVPLNAFFLSFLYKNPNQIWDDAVVNFDGELTLAEVAGIQRAY